MLAIWGIIGYRIISAMSDNGTRAPLTKDFVMVADTASVSDTFTISNRYRDPFLIHAVSPSTVAASGLSSGTVKVVPKQPKTAIPTGIVWLSVAYKGAFRNQTTTSRWPSSR